MDAVTFATGTGGTLAGVGMFLKSKNPKVRVVLADPQVSPNAREWCVLTCVVGVLTRVCVCCVSVCLC